MINFTILPKRYTQCGIEVFGCLRIFYTPGCLRPPPALSFWWTMLTATLSTEISLIAPLLATFPALTTVKMWQLLVLILVSSCMAVYIVTSYVTMGKCGIRTHP